MQMREGSLVSTMDTAISAFSLYTPIACWQDLETEAIALRDGAMRPVQWRVEVGAIAELDHGGLTILVRILKQMQGLGVPLSLSNVQLPVRMVLEMTRLDQVLLPDCLPAALVA